jgi:hypothetical protein
MVLGSTWEHSAPRDNDERYNKKQIVQGLYAHPVDAAEGKDFLFLIFSEFLYSSKIILVFTVAKYKHGMVLGLNLICIDFFITKNLLLQCDIERHRPIGNHSKIRSGHKKRKSCHPQM